MSESVDAEWFRNKFGEIRNEIAKRIVGQQDTVEGVLIGLAANGHILLEGLPGLGKTLLVNSLAHATSLATNRIQFTPDMMPADVTGTNVLALPESGRGFEFRPGPIFSNLILADEINRATPKTQSSMLEAMQELAVTSSGIRHPLDEPFMVMATQNPIEQEGTYPLPEAQLDRFLLKLIVPLPSRQDLLQVLQNTTGGVKEGPQPVATKLDVLRMRSTVREVAIADSVMEYAIDIVLATHPEGPGSTEESRKYSRFGSSPRGAQSLVLGGKVIALLKGRYNVSKEDIRAIAHRCLRHRIGVNYQAEADGMTANLMIDSAIQHVQRGDKDPIKV